MTESKIACCVPGRTDISAASADRPAACPQSGTVPSAAAVPAAAFAGGPSFVGTDDPEIPLDGEGPARRVRLSPFSIETVTVTNERFAAFVAASGYRTEAERIGWSAVFFGLLPDDHPDIHRGAPETPWWIRVNGACWKQPEGPGTDVCGREDHPVTHVSWNDAAAFAAWAGGRLPSEAEWEHAARGGSVRRFPWGEQEPDDDEILCNIWQGEFPQRNSCADGYYGTAPAQSFAPSPDGLYNLAGNVWEWMADPFRVRSLSRQAKLRTEQAAALRQKVLKGGSFLCHKSYCYRYRIAARTAASDDSAASNVGFRIAFDAPKHAAPDAR